MEIWTETLLQFAIIITVFLVLTFLGGFIHKILKNKYFNSINMNELLPEDEVHSLKQIFYLILMALCIVDIFYLFVGFETKYNLYFMIFDIALSLYFAIMLDKSSAKNKFLLLMLIPYECMSFAPLDISLILCLEIIHIIALAYFAKVNFDKFMEYTNSNGLGITIILLFVIIFSSFFITQYAEGVTALDSLLMISNEFTGNGYGVFGHSISGKLNSLLLVWGGYVISGVGAATLTATILNKRFNKRFAELEKLIEGDDE